MSNDGMIMTIFTLILTAALELTAFDQIKGILKRKGGSTLYLQGVTANLINNGIFGPPLYELVSSTPPRQLLSSGLFQSRFHNDPLSCDHHTEGKGLEAAR